MQGGGGGIDGHGVRRAAIGFQAAFKSGHLRALGEEVGLEHAHNGGDVGFRDGLAAIGNHF